MLEIKVTRAAQGKPHPDPDTLVFGKLFTDHMFLMDYHQPGLARPPHRALRAPVPGPLLHGVPLRSGGL